MSGTERHNEPDNLEMFFAKHLQEATMVPSESAWENIEKVLDKKKKKRGIFWIFSIGLLMLIGVSSVGIYLFNKGESKGLISNNEPKLVSTTSENKIKNEASEITDNSDSLNLTNSNNEVEKVSAFKNKIQIGAFRKKVKDIHFNKINLPVVSETGSDGITRYYINSTDTIKDLAMLQSAGFSDAFVKMESNSMVTQNAIASKNKSNDTKENVNSNSNEIVANSKTINKTNITNISVVNPISKSEVTNRNKVKSIDTTAKQVVAVNSAVVKNTSKGFYPLSENVKTDKNNTSTKVADSTIISAIPLNNFNAQKMVNTGAASNQQDSAKNKVVVVEQINAAAKDCTLVVNPVVEPEKLPKDSLVNKPKTNNNDSIKKDPFNRWAIAIIGGPNVFLTQPSTFKNEISRPITYMGEINGSYYFTKNLFASAGVSYQSNSLKKDSTFFRFSKFSTSDYIVNSSYGPMIIDNATLFKGFFMIAPVDSFFSAYKYTVDAKSLSLPLQVNWHFINKAKIRTTLGVGLSTNYVISQKSHLILMKEHTQENFYYNKVNVNRFNFLLMLSLACDIRLKKNLYLTVVPTYKYGITNYSNVPGISYKPNYLSGTAGLKLSF